MRTVSMIGRSLVKYRVLCANEQNGNYVLTAFLQRSAPIGAKRFRTFPEWAECRQDPDLGHAQPHHRVDTDQSAAGLNVGLGYQVAVSPRVPSFDRNWILSVRLNF
jgi:hypothetical protein